MFGKRTHGDIKKSAQKISDSKKDTVTRYKHLKNVLEHVDCNEAKSFFEGHYSNIYLIFYDNFIIAETNLRQKELPFHIVHKAHKEELESVLFVLEKILLYCPELISNRWQCHSLSRILTKLLHPGNSWRLRREAIKYFILWYQTLGDNAPLFAHAIFATLVPGFSSPFEEHEGLEYLSHPPAAGGTFYHGSPVTPADILPIYPPPSGEKQQEDPMKYYLEALLESIVSQVPRIKWKNTSNEQMQKCFEFLFEKFKTYYLHVIFPEYSSDTNLYKPVLDLPELRTEVKVDKYLNCRVSVIKWIIASVQDVKSIISNKSSSAAAYFPKHLPNLISQDSGSGGEYSPTAHHKNMSSVTEELSPSSITEDPVCKSSQVVRSVLFSSRENINLVFEIFRQSFLLPFNCSRTIHRTIAAYREWILTNEQEIPPFMLEPIESRESPHSEVSNEEEYPVKPHRLRNDSYVGAITKENFMVRAGFQNVLQMFITHAANVFLLETKSDTVLFEEQVDTCKRVLNMYRHMVVKIHMEMKTWEQLLVVLLKITSDILGSESLKKKDEKIGGKLAPAIFQTLIVTWIKANLNVVISSELWDQFCDVLSSLTKWEELIKEWAKTMETLTRVLAKQVYNLNLQDLPLERLTEQKAKRRRGFTGDVRKTNINSDINHKTNEDPTKCELEMTNADDCNDSAISCRLRRSKSDSYVDYGKNPTKERARLTSNSSDNREAFESIVLSYKEEPADHTEIKSQRRWRSLDSLRKHCEECSSEIQSRSASPAPSSGIESNSIKDAPIQIDVISNEHSDSVCEVGDENRKSVMAGGIIPGWMPDVAVVLWKRMLGALGNINYIKDPNLHAQVFHYLIELSNTMIKMKHNQGIPEDNQMTPPAPELIPPLTIFAPWCFQALDLPDEYHRGKLCAYKLLCQTTLVAPDCCLSSLYISKLYTALHQGLTSSEKSVVYTIMRHTGPRFFSRQLPGYSILIPDFVQAAQTVLSSNDLGLTPRTESVSILATLLSFSNVVSSFPSFENITNVSQDLKMRILKILIQTAKKEPAGLTRCIAISSLGVFLVQELNIQSKHSLIKEAYNTILLALRFNHEVVAQVACDVLCLLCDYVDTLLMLFPELPSRTVEVLAYTLCSMMPIEDGKKRLLTSLVFCMAEWAMRIPVNVLTQLHSGNYCLLYLIFKVLDELSSGGRRKCNVGGHFNPDLVKEFDLNITLDNLKYDEYEQNPFPENATPMHLNSTRHALQIAAKMVTIHLVNHLGQFPITNGAARLSSLVTEHDDLQSLALDQLRMEIFSLPSLQMFVSTNNLILSLAELPVLEVPGGGITAGLITAPSQVRMILRNLNGKYCWDASILYCTPEQLAIVEDEDYEESVSNASNILDQVDETPFSSYVISTIPQHAIRHRPPHVLPTAENSAPDLDNLDDLLQYIGHTSPECLEDPETPRNIPCFYSPFSTEIEQETIGAILGQKCMESDYLHQANGLPTPIERRPKRQEKYSSFQYCRLLFSQLGYLGWDQRSRIYLIQKTEKTLRELRNLDSQHCRETHKIAVIYVANGQEDKVSILSNSGGSQEYEDFIAALAWEVELENHTGFMGGLQRNKTTGITAPYYATSFFEFILHVSTRMPSSSQETLINKTRHLGNDEVHIVWSEHSRDYRRGIIPTEFCDVLIVIYPLPHKLYRIQISKKTEVPFFGPLFTEVVVEWRILPNLVRSIAVNASRAKRSMLSFHQQHYEERHRSLETIVRTHKNNTTFEDFVAQVYSPSWTDVFTHGFAARSDSMDSCYQYSQKPGTNLAAALIDTSQHSSESSNGHSWQAGSVGVSPRPMKKLVPSTSKASSITRRPAAGHSLTPPETPNFLRPKINLATFSHFMNFFNTYTFLHILTGISYWIVLSVYFV